MGQKKEDASGKTGEIADLVPRDQGAGGEIVDRPFVIVSFPGDL